jgi:hypothetical protein
MSDREKLIAIADRLSEYRKLRWSAPMKAEVEGRYRAVPLTFLDEAIVALTRASEALQGIDLDGLSDHLLDYAANCRRDAEMLVGGMRARLLAEAAQCEGWAAALPPPPGDAQ